MKKVLFVLQNLQGGGAERVVLNLLRNLNGDDISITLFIFYHDGVYWSEIPKNVRIVCASGGNRMIYSFPKIISKLFVESYKNDILVGAIELTPTYFIYFLGRILNKPCIGWVHVPLDNYWGFVRKIHRFLSYYVYKRINYIVMPSQGVADSLRKWISQPSGDKFFVIPNFIDSKVYDIVSSYSKDLIDIQMYNLPVVVGVGRLSKEKGFDILIKAHRHVLDSGIEHNLLILGEGNERNFLLDLAQKLGVAKTVFLPGFVSNPIKHIANSTVFVLSSRFEGFGLVILEAMLAGTPIVATNCPSGPSEILEGGKYGLLVEPNDVSQLAEAIFLMLQNRKLREDYKLLGSKRLIDYSPEQIAATWTRLLLEIVR